MSISASSGLETRQPGGECGEKEKAKAGDVCVSVEFGLSRVGFDISADGDGDLGVICGAKSA